MTAEAQEQLLAALLEPPTGQDQEEAPPPWRPSSLAPATGRLTEEEIKAFLVAVGPITTHELVGRFKSRLKNPEDKMAFAHILKRIARIQKSSGGGSNYIVLRANAFDRRAATN